MMQEDFSPLSMDAEQKPSKKKTRRELKVNIFLAAGQLLHICKFLRSSNFFHVVYLLADAPLRLHRDNEPLMCSFCW